jgi:restriction system protein
MFHRFNTEWSFLLRIAPCQECGRKNRLYVGDTTVKAICGHCRKPLHLASPLTGEHDYSKVRYDRDSLPLPLRPNQWWRRATSEIFSLIVRGYFRSEAERQAEVQRYTVAQVVYQKLLGDVRHKKRQATIAHQERVERDRRAREEADRIEALRKQSAEAETQRAEKMRREEWRQSRAGKLEAELLLAEKISGRDFELLLDEIFRYAGYQTLVTPQSGDQGVDVIVIGSHQRKLAVQAKNYSVPVGNYAVQEIFAGMKCHDCHLGVIIARSGFTRSARQLAERTGVELWGLPEVRRFLTDGKWLEL